MDCSELPADITEMRQRVITQIHEGIVRRQQKDQPPRKWCRCGFDSNTFLESCPWCNMGLVNLSPLLE